VKIHVISTGRATIDADAEWQEPQIREAIEDGCNDVASAIIDHTDSERSDISHDEWATVTEDDGTELWRGPLTGDCPAPLDPIALGQLVKDWQAEASEADRLAEVGPWGNRGEHGNRAAVLRDHARKLGALLGQPS
jgi:hypothetical protein